MLPKSTSHSLWGPGARLMTSPDLCLLTAKQELTSPGGSVLSASSGGCPPHLGRTYHLSGLLELGVEGP